MPSISSSTSLTSSRMFDSVRMLSLILSTTISSKRRALSRGQSQAPLPRFINDWQT
ncbi:MAG: hypothetical protein OXI54_01185 [Chloroflexota bacterium]|nr:hypothetical protein [Chloroflexota bacterium]